MLRVDANNADNTFSADNLTVIAHLLDRSSDLHLLVPIFLSQLHTAKLKRLNKMLPNMRDLFDE